MFNWFRRKFNDSSATHQEDATTAPVENEAEQSVASSEEPSQAVEADRLNWAKAAYQNIKQRQSETAATEKTDSGSSPKPLATKTLEDAPETAPETETVEPLETGTEVEAVADPQMVVPIPSAEEEAAADPQMGVSSAETEVVVTSQVSVPTAPSAERTAALADPQIAVSVSEAVAAPQMAVEAETEEAAADPQMALPNVPSPIEREAAADPQMALPNGPASETQELTTPEIAPVETAPSSSEAPADVQTEAVEIAKNAPTSPLPFWARTEVERQARLERLKATAIEVPEPEVTPVANAASEPTAVAEAPAEIPGLAFDEGFLWSAEILAAQGRRPEDVSIEEITWLKKLRQGLDKTRRNIVNQLKAIVGQGPLNAAAVTEIEALLLQADVGVKATDYIIDALQKKLREEVLPPEAAIAFLKKILRDMLERPGRQSQPSFAPEKDTLNIWLMTGVNGVGKTTTIGKIAHLAQKSGYKCLIGAADTFRAAAVEQVKIWGQRSGTEVIANPGQNTDPAAVVFDAIAAAQSRRTELLLIDTAGRLQNKKNLMDELSKIRRIVDKKAPNAKVESLLVLDATLGQNGLRQAELFAQAAQLSGVVLTKLDGTAKGGVALAVVQQLGLPIYFIGAGEGIEDLRPFSSYEFVEALLSS